MGDDVLSKEGNPLFTQLFLVSRSGPYCASVFFTGPQWLQQNDRRQGEGTWAGRQGPIPLQASEVENGTGRYVCPITSGRRRLASGAQCVGK